MSNVQDFELAFHVTSDLNKARRDINGMVDAITGLGDASADAGAKMRGAGSGADSMAQKAASAAKALNAGRSSTEAFAASTSRVGISAAQTAQAMRQLPAQITDIVTGLTTGQSVMQVAIQQGGQLRDSFGGIAPALRGMGSLIASAFTPLRIAVGGGIAVLAGLATALVKGYLEAQQLDRALVATGNYAGLTGTQLSNLVADIGSTENAFGLAREAVLALVSSGKLTGPALEDAARATVALAQMTGKNVSDVVNDVAAIGDKPVEAVRKLDEQYHFLETSTYAEIRALDEQGDHLGAVALAQKSLADAMDERRQRDVQNLGSIQRAWQDLSRDLQTVWDQLKGIGSQSANAQLQQLYLQRGAAENLADNPITGNIPGIQSLAAARIAAIDKEIAAIKERAAADDAASQAEAKHRQEQEQGNAALDKIATYQQRYATAAQKYKDTIDDINKQFDVAIKAAPEKADQLNAQRNDVLRAAVADYAKSLLSGGRGKGDRSQEAIARAAATAQQALLDSLAQLQGQLSPVAAAWVAYNKAVADADKQAAAAKLGHNANAAAIDAERNAVVANAAAVRDAAIAKIAEQDRKAWDQLRASLAGPMDVHTEQAAKKINDLYVLIQKLKNTKDAVSGQDITATLGDLIDKNLPKAPRARSLRGLPGGAVDTEQTGLGAALRDMGAQNTWFAQAQADLESMRADALAAARKYGEDTIAVQQEFDRKQLALTQQHQQATEAIQQAQYWGEVQIASEAFGQLAQVAAQRYGQDSKQYRLLFALSKTFAVAQAAVSLATNVAKASEVGFPYNIPFIVGAFAQGAEIAALISSATFAGGSGGGGGYAEGGYTGPGGKYQPAGIVHAGEVVFSQHDVARHGGVAAVEALRLGLRAYADGGIVNPLSGVPAPTLPAAPRMPLLAANDDAGRGGTNLTLHNHNYIDIDDLRERILSGPKAETHVVNHVLRNGRTVKQGIG
jgi:phage-related minor tail protein